MAGTQMAQRWTKAKNAARALGQFILFVAGSGLGLMMLAGFMQARSLAGFAWAWLVLTIYSGWLSLHQYRDLNDLAGVGPEVGGDLDPRGVGAGLVLVALFIIALYFGGPTCPDGSSLLLGKCVVTVQPNP